MYRRDRCQGPTAAPRLHGFSRNTRSILISADAHLPFKCRFAVLLPRTEVLYSRSTAHWSLCRASPVFTGESEPEVTKFGDCLRGGRNHPCLSRLSFSSRYGLSNPTEIAFWITRCSTDPYGSALIAMPVRSLPALGRLSPPTVRHPIRDGWWQQAWPHGLCANIPRICGLRSLHGEAESRSATDSGCTLTGMCCSRDSSLWQFRSLLNRFKTFHAHSFQDTCGHIFAVLNRICIQ